MPLTLLQNMGSKKKKKTVVRLNPITDLQTSHNPIYIIPSANILRY